MPDSKSKPKRSLDLEKNEITIQPSLKSRSKLFLIFLTCLQLTSLIAVIQHREVIDNVHQLLNSILLGVISAVFGQSVIQLYRQVHYDRLMKFFIWGALNGLLSSIWIDYLVYNFNNIFTRVLIDQLVGSPFFQLLFVVLNCLWERTAISLAMKTTYITTLKASYLLWPICSLISFKYLPPHIIFPFNCLVSLIWNVVLSLLS